MEGSGRAGRRKGGEPRSGDRESAGAGRSAAERVGAQGSPTRRACRKAQSRWELARRGRPVDGGQDVISSVAAVRAGHRGDEAQQVRVQRVTLLGARAPSLRKDSSAVSEESAYPRVEIGTGPGEGARGSCRRFPGQHEAGGNDPDETVTSWWPSWWPQLAEGLPSECDDINGAQQVPRSR